jgi:hypothetical protein
VADGARIAHSLRARFGAMAGVALFLMILGSVFVVHHVRFAIVSVRFAHESVFFNDDDDDDDTSLFSRRYVSIGASVAVLVFACVAMLLIGLMYHDSIVRGSHRKASMLAYALFNV